MKIFVLDTNIIIDDPHCLPSFDHHDVVIPITVLEELDGLKKGSGLEGANAREFTRQIDKMWCEDGFTIGEGKGKCTVQLKGSLKASLLLNPDKPDNRILGACIYTAEQNPDYQVILVTNDVNLRVKARMLGVPSEGYSKCQNKREEGTYGGVQRLDDVPQGVISELFQSSAGVSPLVLEVKPEPNEYFILRNGSNSAMATYCQADNVIRRVGNRDVYGITPKNAEQTFALHGLCDPSVQIMTITGRAGTGKTLLALAAALEQRGMFRQIMLARPIISLSNQDLGYLPGEVKDKIGPYMQPFYDAMAVIKGASGDRSEAGQKIGKMMEEGKIVMEPLAYIRGRSLEKKFVIIDEAQNLTRHEIKTIVTRAGEGTKIILTGDVEQIDHPGVDSVSNGLSYLAEKFRGQKLYAHVHLQKGERSELSELASNLL